MQPPADVRRVRGDAERAPDDRGDPLARPHLATQAVRLRPALQERGQLGHLLGGAPRLPTRRGMASPPRDALFACPLEPLTDRARRHAQRGGDVLLFPALLFALPGASPPSLAPVELGRLRAHDASLASF